MAAIEDITSLVAETQLRLAEARELAMGAQQILKEYNAERDEGSTGSSSRKPSSSSIRQGWRYRVK